MRYQVLVLADELLNQPLDIEELAFLGSSHWYNHGTFYNANIYAVHTSLSQFTNNYEENYDGNTPKVVMHVDTLTLKWPKDQWNTLAFDTTFNYNGTDNLIFEFTYVGDTDSSVYNHGWFPPGGNRVLDGRAGDTTGTLREYLNRFRIYYTPIGIDAPLHEKATYLLVNYPNPFHYNATIKYGIPHSTHVVLNIYDATGRLVETLVDKPLKAGEHKIRWDAKVASGIYFLKLTADDFRATRKITVLR